MTMISVMRVMGILAAVAFAGQIGLAAAADEPKTEAPKAEEPKKEEPKKKEAPKKAKKGKAAPPAAASGPGGGIQSNKAKASESPRLTKGKSCAGDMPKIKKISPDEGKTGDKVTITGEHFGEPGCVSMVSFGPGSPAQFTQADDKTITATVPDGKKGLEFLTVTGFTGEDTRPFLRK